MQCPKCGGQNPDDAFFCGTCGVQLRSSFSASGPVELSAALDPEEGAPPPHANPFSDAEPTARRAFESSFGEPAQPEPPAAAPPAWAPDAPGAGLAPPPPAMPAPPPPQGYVPPPPQGYAPVQPPAYQPGGYAPQGYRQALPPDGNTSGMGEGYPVPPEASGWTFAGFIPWGLFSFFNGNTTWGVIGVLLSFFGFGMVYWIYVGITGRENAWRNRRFDSVRQYLDTMRAWNNWGIALLVAGFVGFVLYILLVFGLAMSGALDS